MNKSYGKTYCHYDTHYVIHTGRFVAINLNKSKQTVVYLCSCGQCIVLNNEAMSVFYCSSALFSI